MNIPLTHERLNNIEVRHIYQLNKIDERLNSFKQETDERFEKVFDYIASHEESNQRVFFDGQIYDAFSIIADLIYKADTKIILIDNYVDINTLNLLAKKRDNVTVIIYTHKNTILSSADINTFNAQYPNLIIRFTGIFHDRFMIMDEKYGYHIGASIKDAGKKCFAINLNQDIGIIQDIIQKL